MKKNPIVIGLAQALVLVGYISLVVQLMRSGLTEREPTFLTMLLILTVFTTSALISGTITLGYPVYLFWKQKEFKLAIKSVVSTAIWLSFFISAAITFVITT
ncbi:MAG: hypothetical protein A3C03_01225 [Candidatus Colwellbacteria bacterium RIFCSPHIGHO2_02_FULL_45_17]|uniref:DUF5671 domain-containing protein n=1 Tax=Candidatus Colwellbacteria bacterium RIFCSPLOWO2_02_FULL_45_11 TaxID=1797692 RepID=A0A1G1Z822_9BACT|nr:MAG: hypothetical protein A3C03_01225 [Candidatus Colwellbacteria bacterium RIFCSPHIGHO2_02_FULL_45_17]OGY60664.1 MAG: hypothetical protein A3I33_01830 [Candidatus Colwellbacteria bacterium RIFCSPLOWO2_02_FULL_45_11]